MEAEDSLGGRLAAAVSLAGAVAPRAEARARVGFGQGGLRLVVRWRSLVRVAGRRRTPQARRPSAGGPWARQSGQRACSLESSCPSIFVRSFVPYVTRPAVGSSWGTIRALRPRKRAAGPPGVLWRYGELAAPSARSLTPARRGTDDPDGAAADYGAAGY